MCVRLKGCCFVQLAPKLLGEAYEKGLETQGLHPRWDAASNIRNRFRDGQAFLHPRSGLGCDNSVCALNSSVLLPILWSMRSSPDRTLPSAVDIRTEMSATYNMNHRTSKDDQTACIGESLHVREMLSHVKTKTRRQEVSIALQLSVCP